LIETHYLFWRSDFRIKVEKEEGKGFSVQFFSF